LPCNTPDFVSVSTGNLATPC